MKTRKKQRTTQQGEKEAMVGVEGLCARLFIIHWHEGMNQTSVGFQSSLNSICREKNLKSHSE